MNLAIEGAGLLPMFLVGLLGSVHCAGMCGGIVGALSAAPRRAAAAVGRGAFPVPVRTVPARQASHGLARVAAYNAGRIASYAAAGALAGGVAGGVARGGALVGLPALQALAFWGANLMLVALGLYLMEAWRGLAWLEAGGATLWRHVAPLLRRVGPPDTTARMFAAGALWGWLPCAMVYSALASAMLSASPFGGAAIMLAFGLGTLPMLAALGLAGQRARAWLQWRPVRTACGLLILGFGLLGLGRASGGLPSSWLDTLCLTPPGLLS